MIRFKNLSLGLIPRIAVSYTGNANDQTDNQANNLIQAGADIVEIRIDQFSTFEQDYVCAEVDKFAIMPSIATIRSHDEDNNSHWRLSEAKRLKLFAVIIPKVDAIDIELGSDIIKEVLTQTQKTNTYSIASYHNFTQTPNLQTLKTLVLKAKGMGADIVKIATQVNTQTDLQTLAILTANYADQNLIIIGMGELGKISRIALPALGSLLTFAHLGAKTGRCLSTGSPR